MPAIAFSPIHRLSPLRLALVIILLAIAVSMAWAMYAATSSSAPSTIQTQNSTQQPLQTVGEGQNTADDATPNPSGTGSNTILSQ